MMSNIDPAAVAEFEHATWNRCADSYLETFAQLTTQALPLLTEAADISSGSSVLEIGCGPGNVARELAQAGAEVRAIDFSAEMVSIARKTHPSIDFQQANAEKIPAADGEFDAVVANFVVHHLARPTQVFREVRRVLKPGGRFAFVVWGAPEEQTSIGVFFGAVMAHHDVGELPSGPLFGATDRSVYAPMITQAGLKDFELSKHELEWICETLDPILKGFWDWGYMSALPKGTQDKIEAETRKGAVDFEKDGAYVFPHTVMLGSAAAP